METITLEQAAQQLINAFERAPRDAIGSSEYNNAIRTEYLAKYVKTLAEALAAAENKPAWKKRAEKRIADGQSAFSTKEQRAKNLE